MNKMTAANLAVVFGPNLAWSNDKTMVGHLFFNVDLILVLYSFVFVFVYYFVFNSKYCSNFQSLTSIGPINAFTEYLFSNMHQV